MRHPRAGHRGRTVLAVIALVAATLSATAWGQARPTPKRAPAKEQAREAKPAPPRKRPPGVRGMFEAAQELYEAGKYAPALQAYDALLRKFPGHEPAVIQTAKTLYRMDRIKDAYSVFTKVNPQHLDPETSYEFGWSFFTFKSYEGALYAFQRVPRGHALYDLANYYGAICAIKLKKYEDAEDMLEKAVVLPDKLAKSRALYVKHVQALRLIQQQSALANERAAEKSALTEAESKKASAPTAPPAASAEYQHQGFKSITKAAKVKQTIEHKYIDNHGYRETNFDARVSNFEIKSGGLVPLAVKSGKDRQGAFGLQLLLAATDRITEGKDERVVVVETDQDLARSRAKDLGVTDVKSGTMGVEPWVELPLPQNVWINLGADINFTYPEFERGYRYGYRKGYAGLDGKSGALTFGGALSYTDYLDDKTQPTMNAVEGTIYGEGEVATKLTATVTAVYTVNDYLTETSELDGADSANRLEGKVVQALPFEAKATVLASYESTVNYLFHGIPTFGSVAADGTTVSGMVRLTVAPVPFLTLGVEQVVTKTKWALDNAAAADPFEQNVADYVESFKAWLSLNMDF